MKIKKGDKVKILTGKDIGKTGKILRVFLKKEKVVVEGLNLRVKHTRPKKEKEKGQKVLFPAPLNVSNAMLICSKCGKSTRVGYKILENKKKVRICKKCGEVI
ncbi:50S ribosomal protein L24 [Candidatus Kuenenbacteria bacterium HGW-Kuenenbacteria-1]|uniref:Large ribosomal subunit protein uL24 n=1 Tax=Candidatus Kuenenbacteria bacterium HGW-Kuenenbacteria-1 TaxID=2013812 RepID=A0A2N1UNK5_9BACT|nr:MAG: 50S ribosomal protein L24 [Candidatus Kuenenbacteria bacterium HGW-Kuenenbacteria-1]